MLLNVVDQGVFRALLSPFPTHLSIVTQKQIENCIPMRMFGTVLHLFGDNQSMQTNADMFAPRCYSVDHCKEKLPIVSQSRVNAH